MNLSRLYQMTLILLCCCITGGVEADSTITVETTVMEISDANPIGIDNGLCALDEAFLRFAGFVANDCEPQVDGDVSPLIIELEADVYSLLGGLRKIDTSLDTVIKIHGNGATIERASASAEAFQLLQAYSPSTDNSLSISDLTLKNGESEAFGAALNVNGFDLELTSVTFKNNYSKGLGVGTGRGGALMVNSSSFHIRNCRFEGNMAEQSSGAAYFYDAVGSITGSTFSANSAQQAGAITTAQSDVVISGSRFIANTSDSDGGAIRAGHQSNYLRVISSVFQNNKAGLSGGAIDSSAITTNIQKTLFQGNEANLGGAISRGLPFSTVYAISNSTFTQNRASRGGAIAIEHGSIVLVSDTIVVNETSGPGGGIWLDDTPTASISVDHSIIHSNIAQFGANDCHGSKRAGGGYSILGFCDLPLDSTEISQVGVPLTDIVSPLANNGGDSHTFEPVEWGVAHNRGNREYPTDIPADQRGFPRVAEGRVDIGAHERSAEIVVGMFDVIFNHSLESGEALRFFDREVFLGQTGADDATGPLPPLGNQNTNSMPIGVGTLTFIRFSPSSFFFGDFSDRIPDLSDVGDSIDLALNDLEQFDVQASFPLLAFGFDFVDPDGDGTKFHLLACASKFDSVNEFCPQKDIMFAMDFSSSDTAARFFGFMLDKPFSQVSIRELTSLNTNEYFGHFYTVPEP